jgi:hypothetical protein
MLPADAPGEADLEKFDRFAVKFRQAETRCSD